MQRYRGIMKPPTHHGMKYLYCNHAINKMMDQQESAAAGLLSRELGTV